ncbi:MAG TPA: PilZ domain-containing protein [Planctomycetota bacterium]|nr:PilZ domain-containing protein [Planctomycetota bacterium]
MGAEKRRYRRLETNLDARLKNLSDPNGGGFNVRIVNLGPEGAFVASVETIPVQSQVALDFRIDSYPKEINVIAKVLWHKKTEEEKGMGMQFVHIPLFEKNIIIDYILRRYAEYQAKRGGGGGGGD